MYGLINLPYVLYSFSLCFTILIGKAKEILSAPEVVAKLTPTTFPSVLINGPPEFPGFTAASVCITFSYTFVVEPNQPDDVLTDLLSPLITPVVTLPAYSPSGVPIAITV